MPFGDRRGPAGFGPMTGRGAGYCAGYSTPGYMNPSYGAGFGWGRGRGWFGRGGGYGWRNWYYATGLPGWARSGYGYSHFGISPMPYPADLTAKEESNLLKEQAEFLKNQLDEVQKRLSILQKAQEEEEDQ